VSRPTRWHVGLAIIATTFVVVMYASGLSPMWGGPVLVFYVAGVSWIRSRPVPPKRPDLD
jgi:hypothetical protein